MPKLNNLSQKNSTTQPTLQPVMLQIQNRIDSMLTNLMDCKPSRYEAGFPARINLDSLKHRGKWGDIMEYLDHNHNDPEYCKSILYVGLLHLQSKTEAVNQCVPTMGNFGFFANNPQKTIERLNFIEVEIENLNAMIVANSSS